MVSKLPLEEFEEQNFAPHYKRARTVNYEIAPLSGDLRVNLDELSEKLFDLSSKDDVLKFMAEYEDLLPEILSRFLNRRRSSDNATVDVAVKDMVVFSYLFPEGGSQIVASFLEDYFDVIANQLKDFIGNDQVTENDTLLELLRAIYRICFKSIRSMHIFGPLNLELLLASKLQENDVRIRGVLVNLISLLRSFNDHQRQEMLKNYGLKLSEDVELEEALTPNVSDRVRYGRLLPVYEGLLDSTAVEESQRDELSPVECYAGEFSNDIVNVCGVLLRKNSRQSIEKKSHPFNEKIQHEELKVIAKTLRKTTKPLLLTGPFSCGKSRIVQHLSEITNNKLITIHMSDSIDPKSLLGTYITTPSGDFHFQLGVIARAVEEGYWLLLEDLDMAPPEFRNGVLEDLLSLSFGNSRKLAVGNAIGSIDVSQSFRLFATSRNIDLNLENSKWAKVELPSFSPVQMEQLLATQYNNRLSDEVCKWLVSVYLFIEGNSKNGSKRVITCRLIINLCQRLLLNDDLKEDLLDEMVSEELRFSVFLECFDLAFGPLASVKERNEMVAEFAKFLYISEEKWKYWLLQRHVDIKVRDDMSSLIIGRAKMNGSFASRPNSKIFAHTQMSSLLLEKLVISSNCSEPILLTGETGTGKTTTVQWLAEQANKKLHIINLSQHSESSDLLGGFRPVDMRVHFFNPLKNTFDNLFRQCFSVKQNQKYLDACRSSFSNSRWSSLLQLWQMGVNMAKKKHLKEINSSEKKVIITDELLNQWNDFENEIIKLRIQLGQNEDKEKVLFSFILGTLSKAVENGDWILLDEINLAPEGTLDCLSSLLENRYGSIILQEKGEIEPIKRSSGFRVFACMNPSTDIGKRDLPVHIRDRFTEFWVHGPEELIQINSCSSFTEMDYDLCSREYKDLMAIIQRYLNGLIIPREVDELAPKIAQFYLFSCHLASNHRLQCGSGQERPHYSLRTLSRALMYAREVRSCFDLRRALFEGFYLSFCTMLSTEGRSSLASALLDIFKLPYKLSKDPTELTLEHTETTMKILGFPLKLNQKEKKQAKEMRYITTPSVLSQLRNVARAVISGFPVLLQGPTSAGKTTMIEYVASLTNHRFLRINNHEHTELSEYLGTYVFCEKTNKLVFQEGVLIQAMRNGWWIVLDELNLASSDVLEALNRLLDDNKEILIPDTGEVVKPSEGFMLFATQNPAGAEYGGRKRLSRAFRNRFVEVHFDDIPSDELKTIVSQRCDIAPSYASRLVKIYTDLQKLRSTERVFAGKSGWVTLRDLFRWALRDNDGSQQQIGEDGFMIIAERCRTQEDRMLVKQVIEKNLQCTIDIQSLYDRLDFSSMLPHEKICWTKPMKRLFTLVYRAFKHNEPVLLIGGAGCGKTTVFQCVAEYLKREIKIVNCHQHSETSDFIGSLRPCRNGDNNEMKLFEWQDGPLVNAMKGGKVFVLDEISLADDSVLERLNSVLEPIRLLVLAEKGSSNVEEITAVADFKFGATMNPGGDFGKKELSPALRNRFTEIWVESAWEDRQDLEIIVTSKLQTAIGDCSTLVCKLMLDFAEQLLQECHMSSLFSMTHNLTERKNDLVTLRDILSWVEFFECDNISIKQRFIEGAYLVLLDGLEFFIDAAEADSVRKSLSQAFEVAKQSFNDEEFENICNGITFSKEMFGIDSFLFKKGNKTSDSQNQFSLKAKTTYSNARRVLRALQLKSAKPVLLEGAPGVGKTSLITSLAQECGYNLIRINLSEQTDLMDLFGSDLPSESEEVTGPLFKWKDGPFLTAMRHGHWVLLDELNLASQTVLEGLNACLDHRATVYIPELDRSFPRHENFRVFACQNPRSQGGGRKGLPLSFVNRFTKVYVDPLKRDDLEVICKSFLELYNLADAHHEQTIRKVLDLVERLSQIYGNEDHEFNLRDIMRWLQLYRNDTSRDNLEMIFVQRFSTKEERETVFGCIQDIFGTLRKEDDASLLFSDSFIKLESSTLPRAINALSYFSDNIRVSKSQLPYLSSVMKCIEMNWMPIIYGEKGIGKSSMLRFLASMTGNNLVELNMNNTCETADLLGGFEQVDFQREFNSVKDLLCLELTKRLNSCLSMRDDCSDLSKAVSLIAELKEADLLVLKEIIEKLELHALVNPFEELCGIKKEKCLFKWKDGILVDAMKNGKWLLLRNANMCPASVLDRLNSLLDTSRGSIMLHEKGFDEDCVVYAHPQFRLIMTASLNGNQNGLSKAMRNRGIEMHVLPDLEYSDKLDRPSKSLMKILQVDSELFLSCLISNIPYGSTSDKKKELLNKSVMVVLNSNVVSTSLKFNIVKAYGKSVQQSFVLDTLHSFKEMPSMNLLVGISNLATRIIQSEISGQIDATGSTNEGSWNELQKSYVSKTREFYLLQKITHDLTDSVDCVSPLDTFTRFQCLFLLYEQLTAVDSGLQREICCVLQRKLEYSESNSDLVFRRLWNCFNSKNSRRPLTMNALMKTLFEGLCEVSRNFEGKEQKMALEALVSLTELQDYHSENALESFLDTISVVLNELQSRAVITESKYLEFYEEYRSCLASKARQDVLMRSFVLENMQGAIDFVCKAMALQNTNADVESILPFYSRAIGRDVHENLLLTSFLDLSLDYEPGSQRRANLLKCAIQAERLSLSLENYGDYLHSMQRLKEATRVQPVLIDYDVEEMKLFNGIKQILEKETTVELRSSNWIDLAAEFTSLLFPSEEFVDPAFEIMINSNIGQLVIGDLNHLNFCLAETIGVITAKGRLTTELIDTASLLEENESLTKSLPARMTNLNVSEYSKVYRQFVSLLNSFKKISKSVSPENTATLLSTLEALITKLKSNFYQNIWDLVRPLLLVVSLLRRGLLLKQWQLGEVQATVQLMLSKIPSLYELKEELQQDHNSLFYVLEKCTMSESRNETLCRSIFDYLFNCVWAKVEAEEEENNLSSTYVFKGLETETDEKDDAEPDLENQVSSWVEMASKISSSKSKSLAFKQATHRLFVAYFSYRKQLSEKKGLSWLSVNENAPFYLDFYLHDDIRDMLNSLDETENILLDLIKELNVVLMKYLEKMNFLLEEIGEDHSILAHLKYLIEKLMVLRVSRDQGYDVFDFVLTGCQLLYERSLDWNKYHENNERLGIKTHLNALGELIIKHRKKGIKLMWENVIFDETSGFFENLDWTRKLYGLFNSSVEISGEDLKLINSFLSASRICDLQERLDLLKASSNFNKMSPNVELLHEFYEKVIIPAVTDYKMKKSQTLRKEVQDYTKLMQNWKLSTSLDFISVLDTCKKSSRQLTKFRKTYKQDVLFVKVAEVLQEKEASYLDRIKENFELGLGNHSSKELFKVLIAASSSDQQISKAYDFIKSSFDSAEQDVSTIRNLSESICLELSEFKQLNAEIFKKKPGEEKTKSQINQSIKQLNKLKKNALVKLLRTLKSFGLSSGKSLTVSLDSVPSILDTKDLKSQSEYVQVFLQMIPKYLLSNNLSVAFDPEAFNNNITKAEIKRISVSCQTIVSTIRDSGIGKQFDEVVKEITYCLNFVKSWNENGVAYRCSEEIDNVNLNLFKKELVDCEFASSKSYSQQELQYYGRTLTKESFEDVMNTAQQLEAVSIPSVSSFKHPYDQWKEQRMSSLAFVKNAECLTFNGAPGNHNLVQDFKKFMLLRVQNVYKLFGHQVSPEENVKVPKLQQRFNLCTQALAFDKFKELWMNAISQLDSLCVEDLAQLQTLMSIYLNLSQSIASAVKDFYCAITRLADLLINLNILIAKHGFCIPLVPEEEEEEDDKNEEGGTLDGTGMDAGEKGEKNVSDQIENQDQVEGLKDQEPQADDEEDLKNEDGIEMDVGMDNSKSFGEEEGPKEEEKEDEEQSEEEDLDDGMDDLGDQGEELDERMWNEQDQEAEKKDETVRDKSAQSSKEEEKETEAVTGENEYNEEQDKDSANDQPNEMEHDSDDNEQAGSQDELEEEEIDEEGAEGFKPRPVEDDETSEAENQNEEDHELDLNNMDLDDEGDSKEEFNEDENVVDMDEDENEEENVSDSPEDKNIEETAELNQEEDLPMDQDELNTKSTENDSYEQDIADEGHGGAAGGIDKEELEVDPSVESQQQNREQTNQNGLDSESQQNTQYSQSPDTQNGLPPKGSEFTEVLEYWKRNLDILQSSEDPTVNEEQKVHESTQFEFCEQEEDTVALCDSDKTAAPVVDQDKMDEDTKEESSKDADELQESMQNSSSTQRQASAPKESEMAVDDKLNQANEMDVDQEKVEKVEGVNADEFEKDQSSSAQDNLIIQNELLEEELNNALEIETLKISESETYELMDAENAQKIWNLAERTTSVLASRLCEQLRVVLEPTKSSKLAGDFKTGKRLNIKKIIPFIASKYKKDKIWLRRVKPNVRQYQILLAVDDSKSMKESGCVSLAYKSLALVFKAFSQLEVGDIGVVKFGENVQSVYPFGKPFSSSNASEMIRQFTFKQNQTRIPELVQNCIDMLSSQQRQNPNIWQLCIIVSDGLCDDHEKIRRLLSSAAEKRIQILFMLLNHENEELVKIKNVTFVDGKLVMKDYMDSFPFEYYLIMKSIEKLPEALSQTIRQWFESVNR